MSQGNIPLAAVRPYAAWVGRVPHDPVLEGRNEAGGERLAALLDAYVGRRTRSKLLARKKTLASEIATTANATPALQLLSKLGNLPNRVCRALALGVARPRTNAPEGARGLMTAAQAMRAARRYARLQPAQRRRLERILDAASSTGPEIDSDAEQGLILKALAARPKLDTRAWELLETFATAIRGMPRYALMQSTTLCDIDSTRNTSRVNPNLLEEKHPTRSPIADGQANNDGLLQIYDASCGAATAEVLRAEIDPIFAFAVHATDGVQGLTGGGLSDRVQRIWLLHFGDQASSWRGRYNYRRVKTKARALVDKGRITDSERLALLRYCRDPAVALTSAVARTLDAVRRKAGFPSDAQLEHMRHAAPAALTLGTDAAEVSEILTKLVEPHNGGHYTTLKGRGRAFVRRNAEALFDAATAGNGAIIGTTDHWWALLDAKHDRGQEGELRFSFLIHDTYTGITAWVPQRSFEDGTFSRTHFGWAHKTRVVELLVG